MMDYPFPESDSIMVTALPTHPEPFPPRKRWTRDDCRQLEAFELLTPGGYELIDGEIIEKRGQNEPHVAANDNVMFALSLLFGQAYVRHTAPINLGESDNPEPDVAVTLLPRREYLVRGTPTAAYSFARRDFRLYPIL